MYLDFVVGVLCIVVFFVRVFVFNVNSEGYYLVIFYDFVEDRVVKFIV